MIRTTPRSTFVRLAPLALLLAGCTVGPDFEAPALPTPSRYTAEALSLQEATVAGEAAQRIVPAGPADPAWWRLFDSEALDAVVARALEHNPTLHAARFTLAQAQALAAAQAGTRAPQVSLDAGIGRLKYGPQFLGDSAKPPAFTYFAIGPAVSYTLDMAGGEARAVEQQFALADYQRQRLHATYLSVTGNAVMGALRIAALQEQIETVDTLLEQDRENLRLVQTAFQAGYVSRLDVVSAESQLASDITRLPPLNQALSQARNALSVVLGQMPAEGTVAVPPLREISLPRALPLRLPSELVHQRPDILAAEAQLHASTAALGVATANLYPRITLSAAYSQETTLSGQLFTGASNGWSLISGLVAPIFDGGTLRARQGAARAAMQASAARYQHTVLTAFAQVGNALQALDQDAEALKAQTRAQDAAQDNLDLTRLSYKEGNTGVLQVLDAERRYQEARLAFVQIRAQRYLDTTQLFLALGGTVPADDPAPLAATVSR